MVIKIWHSLNSIINLNRIIITTNSKIIIMDSLNLIIIIIICSNHNLIMALPY